MTMTMITMMMMVKKKKMILIFSWNPIGNSNDDG
jgi:hypothetical protein